MKLKCKQNDSGNMVNEDRYLMYRFWKKKNKKVHSVWHLDETYINVKGAWCYLYRTIYGDEHTLNIQLRKTRDSQTAYMFLKRLIKGFGKPTVLNTAPSLLCAFKKFPFTSIRSIGISITELNKVIGM